MPMMIFGLIGWFGFAAGRAFMCEWSLDRGLVVGRLWAVVLDCGRCGRHPIRV